MAIELLNQKKGPQISKYIYGHMVNFRSIWATAFMAVCTLAKIQIFQMSTG